MEKHSKFCALVARGIHGATAVIDLVEADKSRFVRDDIFSITAGEWYEYLPGWKDHMEPGLYQVTGEVVATMDDISYKNVEFKPEPLLTKKATVIPMMQVDNG